MSVVPVVEPVETAGSTTIGARPGRACHDGPMPEPRPETLDGMLQRFWELTQRYAHVGDFDVYLGKSWSQAVPPPAWSFGDSPEQADDLLDLVLAGRKTATTGLYQEYLDEGEPLPRPGELSIILDGAGLPRALVREREVRVVPFGEVTAEMAALEGEGDRSLEYWRRVHRAVFQRPDRPIDDATVVVWERFKLLYPA